VEAAHPAKAWCATVTSCGRPARLVRTTIENEVWWCVVASSLRLNTTVNRLTLDPYRVFSQSHKLPFGLHLYHCHTVPLKRHIHKGLYGAFIVDPRDRMPGSHDEIVMMMNGFDTNFDSENEFYAVNTVAHHYMHHPIRVTVGQPVRIFLVNITEFDLINSFHVHGMFFDVYRTGTGKSTTERTDTITLCQGERAILETTFRYPGRLHVSRAPE